MDVDDTLVLILERIDSAVSLIRAASTCRRWRRVIADTGFLRRFRSLHGPLVAGDYCNDYNTTRVAWFVPSSPIDGRHFSLDFLVGMNIFPSLEFDDTPSWYVRDSRGSLLLVECIHNKPIHGGFRDLVVCEPLTRRYKTIPRPPDFDGDNFVVYRPYLIDGDEDADGGRIGMSNFRVLCVLFNRGDINVAQTTVFTARAMGSTWSEKAIDHIASRLCSGFASRCLGHALGSCYLYIQADGMLITFNGSTGKFSSSVLPQAIKSCLDHHILGGSDGSVVDGGDGEPRIIGMVDHTMEVFRRVDGEWTLEKKIPLSKITGDLPGYPLSFSSGSPTLVEIRVGFVVISWWYEQQCWYFSIDLKTIEVAPVTYSRMARMAYRCEFPWPPVLQASLDW